MKLRVNKRSRLLSLMLSLVLLVGLLPGLAMQADAVSHGHISVSPQIIGTPETYSDGSLKSITVRMTFPDNGYATAYGKIALHRSEPNFDCNTRYSNDGTQWPTNIDTARDTTFVAMETGTEFLWTNGGTFERTLTISTQGAVPAGTYSIYLWTRCNGIGSTIGVYPDAYLETITIGTGGVSLGSGSAPVAHTHSWHAETKGNDTLTAQTKITCINSGCTLTEPLTVSLTASNVTLPGDVFSARITPAPNARVASLPLTVSNTPGYKYSADGSNFQEINPQTFTPKPGIYQASIVVMDGSTQVENLYVKYTVSDPAVTAATGDNRPIGLMLVGLTAFTTMAAAAFLLDNRRNARF